MSSGRPAPLRRTPSLYKPKKPRSSLEHAARVIQYFYRLQRRRRLFESLEDGSLKIYQQKNAAAVLYASASLLQAAVRGSASRRTTQDMLDELEVDEYNKKKAQQRIAFKPTHPPSYYRAAALILQRAAKKSKWIKPRDAPVMFRPRHNQRDIQRAVTVVQAVTRAKLMRMNNPRVIATLHLRRSGDAGGAATSPMGGGGGSPSPVAAGDAARPADRARAARRGNGAAASRYAPSADGGASSVGGEPSLTPTRSRVRFNAGVDDDPNVLPLAASSVASPPSGGGGGGGGSRGAGSAHAVGGGRGGFSAASMPVTPSRVAPVIVASPGTPTDAAVLAEAAETAERQADAEDQFLLADTSGDGLVDEGELLALFAQLLRKRMEAVDDEVLRRYLRTYREQPETPLNLDFDAFVAVYNTFVSRLRSGQLKRQLTSGAF